MYVLLPTTSCGFALSTNLFSAARLKATNGTPLLELTVYIFFLLEKNLDFYYEFTGNASNTILSFNVDDLDVEYRRLISLGAEMINEPTTHPWGARSFQFKDPDGNILNFRSLPKEG